MKKVSGVVAVLVWAVAVVGLPQLARAEGWARYRAPGYGFSMLAPEGAKFHEKEWPSGWGGVHGKRGPLRLYGLAKLGDGEPSAAIEAYGVKVLEIPAEHWKVLDKGKDAKGWKWYRTVKAEHEGRVLYGGYGTGPLGSYILVLKTTTADFAAHREDYLKWYESIRLRPLLPSAEGWARYRAPRYGYSMLIPEWAKRREKEWPSGWGGLLAERGYLRLYGLSKLGEGDPAEAIEAYGVKVLEIPAKHWKVVDKGKDSKGWKWFYTVKAEHKGRVLYGGYGTGPRGSYILVLKTTAADFEAHRAEYQKWYDSITLR